MTETHTADQTILDLVAGEPGLPQREMAAELGMAQATLNRRLSALVADGLLVRLQGGGYCTPEAAPQERTPRALSAVERRAALVEWLRTEAVPPTRKELARAFQCSDMVIAHDVDLLVKAGWVGIDPRMGKWRNLYATRQQDTYTDPCGGLNRSRVLWSEYTPA